MFLSSCNPACIAGGTSGTAVSIHSCKVAQYAEYPNVIVYTSFCMMGIHTPLDPSRLCNSSFQTFAVCSLQFGDKLVEVLMILQVQSRRQLSIWGCILAQLPGPPGSGHPCCAAPTPQEGSGGAPRNWQPGRVSEQPRRSDSLHLIWAQAVAGKTATVHGFFASWTNTTMSVAWPFVWS